MADVDAPKGVFSSCQFAFVPSRALPPKMISELSRTVQKYGGVSLDPESDGRLALDQATHIVANSIDFEQYGKAVDRMLPVVMSAWITHSLSRGKLAQIRPFSPDPRMIFASVNLTCADIPQGDKEAITGATMALGGMESKDLTRLTTHICALSMDHPKCQEAVAKQLKCKIVLPHWFDDCFKLGKKIDETPYLLSKPTILGGDGDDDGQTAIPIPDSQHLDGATATVPNSVQAYRGNLTVFQNRKVMLSDDLGVGDRFRGIAVELIKRGGGKVADKVAECDMFICQYRDGDDYVEAARRGKDVGNLAWLFHLITNNEWCSPLRRLLHYPVPRHGIPGFEDFVITVSNYGGESRIYLENLVEAAGGKFTKTMRMDNTHLITARDNSEKCEAARDWNIDMVNHLWLEESYARCEIQQLTNTKYTTFPPRTNLGEVIGQTFLDEARLRALYYPTDETAAAASEEPRSQPAGTTASRQDDAGDDEPRLAKDDDTGVAGSEKKKTAKTAKAAAAAAAAPPQRSVSRDVATPVRTKRSDVDKENDGMHSSSFLSSGSRSAKDKALSKLHRLVPDIALYEKEKKRQTRNGHAPWGGKRAADLVDRGDKAKDKEGASSVKRRGGGDGDDASSDVDMLSASADSSKRAAKRSRPTLPPVKMRIVLTGYQRWVHSSSKEESERKKLRSLGILIVQDSQPCDYLAAPCLVRTMKFLKTLPRGPEVINAQFITDVLDKGKLLAAEDYALHDPEGEARFGVSLARTLARARANRGRLLWNVVVYCLSSIKNGAESYREIAEANGAIFKLYHAHSGTTIRPTQPEEDGDAPPEPVYLLTSASTAERQLWPRFEKMARDGHMEPRIVAPDWLLDVAMRQEVVFDEHYLATKFWG